MADQSAPEPTSLLTPGKMIVQIIGWLVGIGLLVWVIKGAAEKGDWEKIRHADPLLVVALLGCTIASAVLNGTAFWITIQPIQPIRWRDLQLLNLVANMLNYAPVRLGALLRILYHLRVDRLSLLQIGGWFALIGYILFLGVGACLLATLLRDRIDWIWAGLVLVQMIVGGAIARFMAGNALVHRFGKGVDRLVLDHRGLWGAIGLRLLDLAAYAGRMAAALAILDMHLPFSHVIVLALIALAASLMPVGKVGFREFCVAAAAARLSMSSSDVQSGFWEQLALIESAGEALFFIPTGAIAMLWFRKRWMSAKRLETEALTNVDSHGSSANSASGANPMR